MGEEKKEEWRGREGKKGGRKRIREEEEGREGKREREKESRRGLKRNIAQT